MRYYVQVVAGSSRIKVEDNGKGNLKVWLKAKPIENKANLQLIEVLADHFLVRKSQINILAGRTAKKKLIEVRACSISSYSAANSQFRLQKTHQSSK